MLYHPSLLAIFFILMTLSTELSVPLSSTVLICIHKLLGSSRLPYLTTTLKPDLIFFQAGVDPHKGEPVTLLAIEEEG